jgi:hypothetical protein
MTPPPGLGPAQWHTYEPPLLALAASLALMLAGRVLAGRARGATRLAASAAAAGALLGWWVQLAGLRRWRALFDPASTAQHLLLVAVVALGTGLLAPRLRERWLVAAGAVLAGWWVARSPVSGEQFWRAWLVIGLLVALLARAGDAIRVGAVPLALAAGLCATGAPAPWLGVALTGAAAALPVLVAHEVPALPLAILGATTVGAADLGAGRLARGGFGPVDAACLLALLAPLAVALARGRMRRAAPLAPVLVAAAVGLMAWGGRLALAHR